VNLGLRLEKRPKSWKEFSVDQSFSTLQVLLLPEDYVQQRQFEVGMDYEVTVREVETQLLTGLWVSEVAGVWVWWPGCLPSPSRSTKTAREVPRQRGLPRTNIG